MINISPEQINSLQEIINIGVGEAAGTLNEIIDNHIELQIPYIKMVPINSIQKELEIKLGTGKFSAVDLQFFGSINGNAELIFPTTSATKLVSLLSEEEEEELSESDLDELKIGALTEIGNIVISGIMGAISNLLSQDLEYLLPSYQEGDIETLMNPHSQDTESSLVFAQTRFLLKKNTSKGIFC